MSRPIPFRLAIVAAAAVAVFAAAPARAVVQVGQAAPDFTKTDLTGTSHTLSASRGKIVLLFLLGYG